MNAREIQVALQQSTTEPVGWTTSELDGSLYIGSEDNVDAIIVVGPFPPDQRGEVDAVNVGLNGAEHQERATDVDSVVAAVDRLLPRHP